jgi:hypothetical protein
VSWARILGGILAAVALLIVADLHGALRTPRPTPTVAPTRVAETQTAFRPSDETPDDLPPGPGREATFYFCTACHGTAIIKAQGMRHDQWDEALTWMEGRHNMPRPEPAAREAMLDYLAHALPSKPQPRGWVNPFVGR